MGSQHFLMDRQALSWTDKLTLSKTHKLASFSLTDWLAERGTRVQKG